MLLFIIKINFFYKKRGINFIGSLVMFETLFYWNKINNRHKFGKQDKTLSFIIIQN